MLLSFYNRVAGFLFFLDGILWPGCIIQIHKFMKANNIPAIFKKPEKF